MISVVIPTLNAEARLAACLDALGPVGSGKLVGQIVIADGGSTDRTIEIAERFGATVVTAPAGRGGQLRAGAEIARGDWFLFLHADTVLDARWARDAAAHIKNAPDSAAVFTLAFDTKNRAARFVSGGAMMRTRLFGLPYGDQGLLISRRRYHDLGGYRYLPLFEDVDIVRRLIRKHGRRALCVLPAVATTSAERYERLGYARCVIRNNILLARFLAGVTPEALMKDYR